MRRKICFWVNSVFKLGGIKRVVTNVSNLLSIENEVTIITNDSINDENREKYGLSERINIIYMDEQIVSNWKKRINTIHNKKNDCNQEKELFDIERLYISEMERQYYIEILTIGQYDWVVGVADLGVVLATISESITAKTVWWQHNRIEDCLEGGKCNFYNNILIKKYIYTIDHVVVPTELEAQKYVSMYAVYPTVIFNPIGFSSEVTSDLSVKCFLVASRITYMKGIDLLIKAFAEFSKLDKEWKLIVAGEGPEYEEMIKLAKDYGVLDRIIFLGFTNKIKECLLNSSVLLVPSRSESWGLTILEAFEFGVPVISWDYHPLNTFFSNGCEGILVTPYDINEFSNAMRDIASNKMKLLKMGEMAKKRANEFNDEEILNKWVDLFNTFDN